MPLTPVLKHGSREIEVKPIVTEGAYALLPPHRVRQQIRSELHANVGVSVSLRREEIPEGADKVCLFGHSVENLYLQSFV